MCCAREANISAISASGDSPAVVESSSSLRILSPVGVPPGSRVSTTLCPAARTTAASFRSCVLFPVPSSPSNVMNFPRRDICGMIPASPAWNSEWMGGEVRLTPPGSEDWSRVRNGKPRLASRFFPSASRFAHFARAMGQYLHMQKSFTIVYELFAAGMMLVGIAPAQTPAAPVQSSQPGSTQPAPPKKPVSVAKKGPVTSKSAPSLTLKTQKEKASYALGMKIGGDLRKKGGHAG